MDYEKRWSSYEDFEREEYKSVKSFYSSLEEINDDFFSTFGDLDEKTKPEHASHGKMEF